MQDQQNAGQQPGAPARADRAANPQQRRSQQRRPQQRQRGTKNQNTERFDAIDANNDGHISLGEYSAKAEGRNENVKRVFQRLDRNDDGKITRREAQQYVRQMQKNRGRGGSTGQR